MTTTYHKMFSCYSEAARSGSGCNFFCFFYNQALKSHFSTISATLNTLVAGTSICSTATSHLLDMGPTGGESFWVQYDCRQTFEAGFRVHRWATDTLYMYKTDTERGKKAFLVNVLCSLLMNQYAKTIVPFCETDLKVRTRGLVRPVTAG